MQSIGDAIGISQLSNKIIGLYNNKFTPQGKTLKIPPGYRHSEEYEGASADSTDGNKGLYLSVIKERHGQALYPCTLQLNPVIAQIGGDSGAELCRKTNNEGGQDIPPKKKNKRGLSHGAT